MFKKISVRLILISVLIPLSFFASCKDNVSQLSPNSQAENDRRIVSRGSSGNNDLRSTTKRILAEIRENEDYSTQYIEESSINECENLLLAILAGEVSDRDFEILDILLIRMAELDPSLTMDLISAQPEGKVRKVCLDMFFSKLTKIEPLKEITLSRRAQTREDANFIKSTLSSRLSNLPISILVDLLDDSSLSEAEAALLHSSIGVRAGFEDLSYEEVSKLNIGGKENELIENWAIIKSSKSPVELAELISNDENALKMVGKSLPTVAGNYANRRPQDASEWIVSFPESENKIHSLTVALHLWLSRDAASAGQWVNSIEESVSKDHARHTIAVHLRDQGELARAKEWADSISDEEVRDSINFKK